MNKQLVWGTANPVPSYDPEFRPGDNLFTDSTIAFDINTGKMKWYFQLTPNDGWDYDENGVNFVFDAPINGVVTHQIGHFGRNGFYYNWKASDGQFINGGQWTNELTAGRLASIRRPASRSSTTPASRCRPTTGIGPRAARRFRQGGDDVPDGVARRRYGNAAPGL